MKTTLPVLAIITLLVSCQRDVKNLPPSVIQEPFQTEMGARNPTNNTGTGICPYSITLATPVALNNGRWQWTWTVQNNNTGNGNGGTVQNLSHWGFFPSACFNLSAVVSAAYSTNGTSWTTFTPTIGRDPSSCVQSDVFKFGAGTSGNAKTYYRLVLNQNFPVGTATGYYKSGINTGCGTFTFPGIACGTGLGQED